MHFLPIWLLLPGLLISYWLGYTPLLLSSWLLLLSLLTMIIYAKDKSAASKQRWRVPEQTLHSLAMAGGWPGALVAQQWLRHKTRKRSFRRVFWFTVLVNVTLLGLLHLDTGQQWQQVGLGFIEHTASYSVPQVADSAAFRLLLSTR